jgi:hypothetical protein
MLLLEGLGRRARADDGIILDNSILDLVNTIPG